MEEITKFIQLIAKLRGPGGCPWDREQNHMTLRKHLLEECFETVEAIESGISKNIREELGDLLLQIVLHAQIAKDEGTFDIEDVAREISEKIIRRHPHVFGEVQVSSSEEVLTNWEKIKQTEKPERTSAFDGITFHQPALMTALKLSKKAVKTGFEWPNIQSLLACLESEMNEFKHAAESKNPDAMQEELGDLLFCVVNLGRWYKLEPEFALRAANHKFYERFTTMEQLAGGSLNDYQGDLEELWNKAKEVLANGKEEKAIHP